MVQRLHQSVQAVSISFVPLFRNRGRTPPDGVRIHLFCSSQCRFECVPSCNALVYTIVRVYTSERTVRKRPLAGVEAVALVKRHSRVIAPGTAPPIGSLAGKLSLVNSSAGAQFQSFADGSVLAARLLYLGRRGWLWRRDFEAYGVLETDPDQVEETVMKPVEGDRDDEYFALV